MDKLGDYESKDDARGWGGTLSLDEAIEIAEILLTIRKELRARLKLRLSFTPTHRALAKKVLYNEAALAGWASMRLQLSAKRCLDSRAMEFMLPVAVVER